ncbi:MAG: 6-bladed beta-propeller, partial [Acidobacteria bacterium]|nr:6-bladed beta-propeller [Acidobacteriota bacterium]
MFVSKGLIRIALVLGVASALAAVSAWSASRAAEAAGVPLLQHDPNARNTLPRSTEPVDGKGGEDLSGAYVVDPDWPQPLHPNTNWIMGGVAGVYAESAGRVYVATRGEIPPQYDRRWGPATIPTLVPAIGDLTRTKGRWEHIMLVYDRNGKLLESWDQWDSMIKGPNRLLVSGYDPERHVWLVDQGSNQIFKFTHDGKKLVLTIGEKDVPKKEGRFSVQEMAWLPSGEFYVVGGSRVMKFSKEGKYLSEFGKEGSGPGEFSGMHGIIIDAQRRIYLADRGNSRIHVVDENGKYLDQWPNIVAPYCIRLSKDGQHLWVSDGYTQRFGKYDLNGR